MPRNHGSRVKLILTQFRNCAAPAGRPPRPAGTLRTRRRPKLGGRPAPVPAAPSGAPPSAALGGPHAQHRPEALAPGAPSRRTSRPALGECGRRRLGCRGVGARGQRLRRPQEPPPLSRAGERGWARSGAAGAVPDGGVGGRLAPAAGASGQGAGLGAGPDSGTRAAPPLRRAAGKARERSGAGAPPSAGRSGYSPGSAASPPEPRRFARAGRDIVTELGRQRCIVGAFKVAGGAARPLGPTGPGSPRSSRFGPATPRPTTRPRPPRPVEQRNQKW